MMVDSDSDDDCCLLIEPETTGSDHDAHGLGPMSTIQATATTTTTTPTAAGHFKIHPSHDDKAAPRPLVRSHGARHSAAPRYPHAVYRTFATRADVGDGREDDSADDQAEPSEPEAALSRGDMSAVFKAMISEEVWGSNLTVPVRWLRHGARSTFIKFWLTIILILLSGFIAVHISQSGSAVKKRHSNFDGPSTRVVYQDFVLNHMHWEFEPRVDVGTRSTATFEIDYEWCYSSDFSQAFVIPFAAYTFFQWCDSPMPERNLTEEVVIQTLNELASSNNVYGFFYYVTLFNVVPLVILAHLAWPANRSKYPSEVLSGIAGVLPKGSMMVSYRHADFAAELARRIPRLFPKGICWLDKDALLEGMNLPKTISTAAANADIGFVMLSKSYLRSQNCCYELLSFEPRLEPLFAEYADLYRVIARGQDVDKHDKEVEDGAVRLNLNYLVPRKPRLNHNAAGNGLAQPLDENHCAKLVVYCLEEPIIRGSGYSPNTAREKRFVAAAIEKLRNLGHEVVMLRHPENDHPDDHDVRRFNWANSYHARKYASFSPRIYDDPRKANIFMRGVRSFFAVPSVHQDSIAREMLKRLCPTGILRHALQAHQRVPPIDNTWRQLAAYSTDRAKSLKRTEVWQYRIGIGYVTLNQLTMLMLLAGGATSQNGESRFPFVVTWVVITIGFIHTLVVLIVCKTSWTSTSPKNAFPKQLSLHCLIACNKLGLARVVNVYYSTHGVPDSFVRELKYLHEIGVINLDNHVSGDDMSSSSTSSPTSAERSDENPSFNIINLEKGDGTLHVETVSSIDPEASAFYFAPKNTFDEVAFAAGDVNRRLGDIYIQTHSPDSGFNGFIAKDELKVGAVALQLLKVSLGLDRGAT